MDVSIDGSGIDRRTSSGSALETDSNGSILSVYWRRGRLGAAYYDCSTSELFVLNDMVDVNPSFIHLTNLISLANPTEVVTCRGVPELFLTTLRSLLHLSDTTDNNNDSSSATVKKLMLLPGGRPNLNLEACQRTVQRLRFHSEDAMATVEEHEVFVGSVINLANECLVISLALLVRHLEKYLPHILLSNDWGVLTVHEIRLKNAVSVDEETRRALQIFAPQQHPSAFKRGEGRTREGLSLMGFLGRCRSPNGETRMREMLATPTRDRKVLEARLSAVDFCCRPHSQAVVSTMATCVAKVRSVATILTRICQTHGSVTHWKTLYSTVYHAIRIGDLCSKYASASNIFKEVGESITVAIKEVAHYINLVVDFEESSRQNKFSVHYGIDHKLDKMQRTYTQVPEVLLKVAELELNDLPDMIQRCSIVCITELGYLLSVPAWLEGDADTSLYHLPNFQVKFVVNNHVYYKTPRCAELDQILGDLIAKMSEKESSIMVVLTQFIRARIPDILRAVRLIADLDCILSFAEVARVHNFVRPEILDEPGLEIVGGRHPLQELCVDSFVPNDTHLGTQSGLIKLITGPNASGKSVYLKQVALIAYMAHIGSFVPADRVKLGIMDHIRTRIQTVESITAQMSAFFIDLKQILQCLYNSSRNSLLIIDEFGKGTSEIDGQALLAACLSGFGERGRDCPLIIASTHFHQVPKLLPNFPLISLQKMTYVEADGELVCLYKLEEGEAGYSFALLVAKAAGMPETYLNRACKILSEPSHCTPNPTLKSTQYMIQEIKYMLGFFDLLNPSDNSQQEVESQPVDNSVSLADLEQLDESRRMADLEPLDESQRLANSEPLDGSRRMADLESLDESGRMADSESLDESGRMADSEPLDESQRMADSQPLDAPGRLVDSELSAELAELAERLDQSDQLVGSGRWDRSGTYFSAESSTYYSSS